MPQERTDTGIDAVYARLETAERALDQIRARHDVTLNTLNKTYGNLLTAVDTLSRFKSEYEAMETDLKAARTASALADIHYSTSRLVLIEVKELLAKEEKRGPAWISPQKVSILQKIRALLGEVTA